MSKHRFEVTRVPESSLQSIDPIVKIEHEIPLPPPLPISFSSSKLASRISSNIISSFLKVKPFDVRRRTTISAVFSTGKQQLKKSSSADILRTIESIDENEESDVYLSIQSSTYDSNPLKITNKFLNELRLKRQELRAKAKNFTIDQRISFLRRENQREILRAQDIFDVHFELEDENENLIHLSETNFFTEETQEKIRTNIYNELDRQRHRQFDKQHRHLILGRTLLFFMILLLIFMSLTLLYVVIDIYYRANILDFKLPDNEFLPINKAQLKDFY